MSTPYDSYRTCPRCGEMYENYPGAEPHYCDTYGDDPQEETDGEFDRDLTDPIDQVS